MKVLGMARLTKDAEVRYSQGEKSVAYARGSIAVNRKYKKDGQPDADFFNYTALGKVAEFLEKYGKKGTKFFIEGHLENNNYTNKEGQMIYQDQIVIESLEFAESKNSGTATAPAPASAPTNAAPAPADEEFMNIPDGVDEELPFV